MEHSKSCFCRSCIILKYDRVLQEKLGRIAELEKENAALKAEREWISVNERLPDKNDDVLCGFFDDSDWNVYQAYLSDLGFMAPDYEMQGYVELATHWMPLPTPPTTEEDNQ